MKITLRSVSVSDLVVDYIDRGEAGVSPPG